MAPADLRDLRLAIDISGRELAEIKAAAAAAALPVRAWARDRLLSRTAPAAAHPADLREIWRESSTLQSNFNQLVQRLNELHAAGELHAHNSTATLLEMHRHMPSMYKFIKAFRVDLLRRK